MPSVGNNLLTFMANRLIMSYVNLNCQDFALANPVKVTRTATAWRRPPPLTLGSRRRPPG